MLPRIDILSIDAAPVESPTAIDLFSGAGGFSLGALEAGFHLLGALESSNHASATYRNNIVNKDGSRPVLIEENIEDVEPRDALERWGIQEGECHLLLGGPPCQGFSKHRYRDSGVNDPRNRLLARYFDYVSSIKPKAFLMENVPGLLWDRHRSHLETVLRSAERAGYKTTGPLTLNAADYGVPQRRKRVFILGVLKSSLLEPIWPPPLTHHKSGEKELRPSIAWANCRSAFHSVAANDPNARHMQSSEALVEAFRATPVNGGSRRQSGRLLACHRDHDGHSDVYGRIDPDKPAPTMTTACINPSKGRFVHPTEPRGISVREAARIQTFPDQFVFSGGLMASGVQIGNAVPVLMAEKLLNPLYAMLSVGDAKSDGE